MKKKIVIGLSLFSLIFLLGGIYIITTIERGTKTLNDLIILHQVEILREHLLIQVQQVQSDLYLKNTRFARDTDTIANNIKDMQKISGRCLECHHSEDVIDRLTDLRDHIEAYKNALGRVFTIKADIGILEIEENNAFKTGESLVNKISNMIVFTSERLEKKTESTLKEIAHAKNALFILVVTGPLLSIGLAFIFIRAFTKQVNVLLDATRRLKGGDLDFRIERLKDEFGEVAASFNDMAGSLKEQMIKIQRTEQMVVLGELAAGLAHEIKNPLAGIKVSMEVLAEEDIPEEERTVILKVINEIRRIELLIKSLLNFAKPPKPEFTFIDLNDIIDKTITFSLKHPSLSSNNSTGIKVLKDFDDNLPKTMADPMQLQQAFLNLLLNAVDAMPDGGTLTVKTSHHAEVNSIQIAISDTGKGIDKGVMNKIFQPFFTTKSKGTGLGLAITKRLIEQHGGSISVENNPGRGVIFNIFFPVKQIEKGQNT